MISNQNKTDYDYERLQVLRLSIGLDSVFDIITKLSNTQGISEATSVHHNNEHFCVIIDAGDDSEYFEAATVEELETRLVKFIDKVLGKAL